MKIAILGFGTIGKGVYEIISSKKEFQIIKILEKKEKIPKENSHLFTDNIEEIINDSQIELVVEVLGGYDFAYNAIKQLLKAKKHVVSANKEVVAKSIDELTKISKENNVKFLYEASVGGGIPIIKNLSEIKLLSSITAIKGILNGTTNYILTKISQGLSYEEALKKAQELGFAEKDPTADVEGYDMMRKIAILSDISWDTKINIEDIKQKGITSLTKEDFIKAKNNNQVIKFLCYATKDENHINIGVKPFFLEKNHLLANINDETNAVVLQTYPNDELIFIGKGAGSLPTAASIVGDIINILNQKVIENYQNKNKFTIN